MFTIFVPECFFFFNKDHFILVQGTSKLPCS